MPRKTVSKCRTRVKARVKRMTRRRKGGECGDITKYEDNYNCVQAGCDPFECAQYYRASKPHRRPDDYDDELAEQMKRLKLMEDRKKMARESRRKSRAASRKASIVESNANKPSMQELFNTFVSSLDKQVQYLIANEPRYKHHEYIPIVNMNHKRLAKYFEEELFYALPPERKSTITDEMRLAKVIELESLMGELLKNYNASVVGQGRD